MFKNILAEAAGIFAGDGTFYKTQNGFVMEIRGPSKEKPYYEDFVAPIFSKVFNSEIKVINRDGKGKIIGIRYCKKNAKDILHKLLNFPIGKKESIVQIPKLIFHSGDKDVVVSYLRGLFDTDGCVSLTKKSRKI